MVAEVNRRKTYTARAVRSGDWWAISVPGLRGLHSQARRLDQAEKMTREAITLFLDVPLDSVRVQVEAILPPGLGADVRRAKLVRLKADNVQEEAASATAKAARALVHGAHLTVREAAQILGVSHQRIAQLVHR